MSGYPVTMNLFVEGVIDVVDSFHTPVVPREGEFITIRMGNTYKARVVKEVIWNHMEAAGGNSWLIANVILGGDSDDADTGSALA